MASRKLVRSGTDVGLGDLGCSQHSSLSQRCSMGLRQQFEGSSHLDVMDKVPTNIWPYCVLFIDIKWFIKMNMLLSHLFCVFMMMND